MSNYDELNRKMGNKKRLTLKSTRAQVYAERLEGGDIGILLHETYILIYKHNGHEVVLNTGGWETKTTKERMNDYLPAGWSVWQKAGVWYVGYRRDGAEWVYKDHMSIDYMDPKVHGAASTLDVKRAKKQKESMKRYVAGYIKAFKSNKIDAPSTGDCVGCLLGAIGADHIESHMKEKYYVPSLLMNAIEVGPVSQVAMWLIQQVVYDNVSFEEASFNDDFIVEQIRKCLMKYIKHELDVRNSDQQLQRNRIVSNANRALGKLTHK